MKSLSEMEPLSALRSPWLPMLWLAPAVFGGTIRSPVATRSPSSLRRLAAPAAGRPIELQGAPPSMLAPRCRQRCQRQRRPISPRAAREGRPNDRGAELCSPRIRAPPSGSRCPPSSRHHLVPSGPARACQAALSPVTERQAAPSGAQPSPFCRMERAAVGQASSTHRPARPGRPCRNPGAWPAKSRR